MNLAKRLMHSADRLQQGRPWLALPVATWKKFGDDQAGNLAALIAYYAFLSIFPLLLVLVTVLGIVLKDNSTLHQELLNSTLANYPVIGEQLKSHVHPLQETGAALVVGIVVTVLGARGVAGAITNAMNTAWAVPMLQRPGFPWSLVRNLALMAVIGIGQVGTVFLSGIAGGAGHLLSGAAAHIGALLVSLVLNIGVFWLSFRLGTAREVRARDMLLGAVISGIAWQLLQALGGYLVAHQLARSSSLYGTFGIVLGLLAWLYLQAQITLYAVELNVVRVRRLWPRSMSPPPLTEADVLAYRLYAAAQQRRAELAVELRPAEAEPAEAQPAGTQPAEAQPSGTQPAEAQRAQPAVPPPRQPKSLPRRSWRRLSAAGRRTRQ
jgi:membrane protein